MQSHFRNDSCLTTYLTTWRTRQETKKIDSAGNPHKHWVFQHYLLKRKQGMRESNYICSFSENSRKINNAENMRFLAIYNCRILLR